MSTRIIHLFHVFIILIVVLSVISFLCNLGVNFIGDFEVEGQEKLQEFVYNRDKETPLITCCNHIDAFDDPVIISATLGWKSIFYPSVLKSSLSAEEYCFKSPGISEFFTFGRIMPIKRGSGIYQFAFLEFIQRLKFGEWLHIFPEGRTLQDNGCPVRDSQGRWYTDGGRTSPPWRHLGPLKWGIGKMIADSPVKPLVVPFYHKGLDKAWPHDDHNHVKSIFPYWNTKARVKVGDPINFDDILDEYNSGINKITGDEEIKIRKERLYKDLTDRVEEGMAKLEPDVLNLMKEKVLPKLETASVSFVDGSTKRD